MSDVQNYSLIDIHYCGAVKTFMFFKNVIDIIVILLILVVRCKVNTVLYGLFIYLFYLFSILFFS